MIRIFGTILAGLLGLAFGSFLNVCLSRWPEGESVVRPRSHCRNCGRTLTWWENIPVASWLFIRGRCRTCKTKISWRYPLIELSVGALWAAIVWQEITRLGAYVVIPPDQTISFSSGFVLLFLTTIAGRMIFAWSLVALAALDAEHLWLPNWITFPGIALGLLVTGTRFTIEDRIAEGPHISKLGTLTDGLLGAVIPTLIAALLVLLIRWTYYLIRRREGIGLGDAKLMAMLGAWLGLSGAMLSFAIGVFLGAIFALVLLAVPVARRGSQTWSAAKLPLGTFLCIGGIITSLWGRPIIDAYLRSSGF